MKRKSLPEAGRWNRWWLSPKRRGDQRGAVAIMIAVFLIVVCGLAALVVDLGHLFVIRSRLQNAADSASLAAAASLNLGPYEARNQARFLAQQYSVHSSPVTLTDADIELGSWDKETKTFTVLAPAQEGNADSVRVTARRTSGTGAGGVPTFFARIWGIQMADVSAVSVAYYPGPCGAIIGTDGVTIHSDAITDSYDSRIRPYSPATANQNGDVCSCKDITLLSSAIVNGDATPGRGKHVYIGSDAIVTGSTAHGLCPVLPPIKLGGIAINNDNKTIPGATDKGQNPFHNGPNDLWLGSSDGLTLGPGRYYFTSVKMGSDSTLRLTGPATIYVIGRFHVNSSAVINGTRKPKDLVILISSTGLAKLDSDVYFKGVIYAPDAWFHINSTANYFGTLMAKGVDIKSSTIFHYDEALEDILDELGIPITTTMVSYLVR